MSPLRRRSARRERSEPTLRLYYASDIHGSDQCWRKFVRAGKFYGAEALIMGGDLTGKAIVPMRLQEDGSRVASLLGDNWVANSDEEVNELIAAIRYNGMYPWTASESEIVAVADASGARDALFEHVMLEELRRWMELAEAVDQDAEVYVIAGNDDPWKVDEILAASSAIRFCDGQVVRVGEHEMLSSSYSNPTPWESPRELNEDSLYRLLRGLADQLEQPERAIFNLHVPPYDTGLDTANEVDPATLTYVQDAGRARQIPVGSHAVRQIVEEVQPLLSLHGHIHESRGATRIGRTVAINSGSEYTSGRIHGALVELAGDQVVSRQLVVG